MNELTLFDSFLNDVFGDRKSANFYNYSFYTPKVDVKEDKDAYTIEMELPGRNEDDVNIELDHNNLTIESKTQEEKEEKKDDKKTKYILKERHTSSFSRRFTLPSDADSETIKANFKNGVLIINMQKKALASPKRIAIEAN